MFKKLVENRIVYCENHYACYSCKNKKLGENLPSVFQHINQKDHINNLKRFGYCFHKETKELQTISDYKLQIIIKSNVTYNKKLNSFKCNHCNNKIFGWDNIFRHIADHKNENFNNIINIDESNISKVNELTRRYIIFDPQKKIHKCNICNLNIEIKNVNTHINGCSHKNSLIEFKRKFKNQFIQIYYCIFCEVFLKDIKQLQYDTMFHLYEKFNIPSDIDIIIFKSKSSKSLKCLVCNIDLLNIIDLSCHLESQIHLRRLMMLPSIQDDIKLNNLINIDLDFKNLKETELNLKENYVPASHCTACDLAMFNENIINHICEDRHIILSTNLKHQSPKLGTEHLIINTCNLYICFICKKSFSNAPNLLNHYQEIVHQKMIQCFLTVYYNDKMVLTDDINQQIYCILCKVHLSTCTQAVEHILDLKHQEELKLIELNNAHILKKHKITNNENLHIIKTKDDKITAEKLKVNYKQTVSTLIERFGKSFIKYCINSNKYNIYINKTKIKIMKFGFNFIFPLHNNKRFFCILCCKKISNKQSLFEHLQYSEHIKKLKEKDTAKKRYYFKFAKFCIIRQVKKTKCYACNIQIRNKKFYINNHINNVKHYLKYQLWKSKSVKLLKEFLLIIKKAWYYAQVYICAICNTNFDMEIKFVKHLVENKHLKLDAKNKNTVEFHICPACVTYWYGSSNSYQNHCTNTFHQYFVKRGDLMVHKMSNFTLDLLKDIDQSIIYLLDESNNMIKEYNKELEILNAIEDTVKCVYPNAKCYKFGSRLSYLSSFNSDLDVFLDCHNSYNKHKTEQSNVDKHILHLSQYFKKESNIWVIYEIILKTKEPIIKLSHIPTGLDIDISFINGLSVEKTKLIRNYNDACQICRNLILYLRKWFSFNRIHGKSGISTYAISCFVIFYLQVKHILPSVLELIKRKNESKLVAGWECGFSTDISVTDSNMSFKDHAKAFFSYYANFNYQLKIICPYLGKAIKKNSFVNSNKFSEEMKLCQENEVKYKNKFNYVSPLCIQDPLELTDNITERVTKLQLRSLQKYCHQSAKKLSTT